MTKDHFYRGYLIEKPERCAYWNIREIDENGMVNWCFAEGYGETLKKARETIDYILSERGEQNGTGKM